MKFLFQNNLLHDSWLDKVRKVAKVYPTTFVDCIPFETDFKPYEEIIGLDYIPYGSINFGNICSKFGFTGFCVNDNFSYSEYTKHQKTLNNGIVYDAESAIKFFKENDGMWFCKPNVDDKKFNGEVQHSNRWILMLEDMLRYSESSGSYGITKDFQVIISEPREIQMEVRWFIVGGKIVDGSTYRVHNQLRKENVTDDKLMVNEAQEFADIWLPHDNCVMDLALVDDELFVVEFNSINSSGFYDNNHDLIFKRLYEYWG